MTTGKDLGENAGVITPSITVSPLLSKKTTITGVKYLQFFGGLGYLFDFLWLYPVDDNYLISILDGRKITITGKDFVTDYIPGTSAATLKLQADADFIYDDCTDNLWFDFESNQRSVTIPELILDNYRSLILYSNTSPFDITGIGILKSTVILTQSIIDRISDAFRLWVFWSQVWNNNGYIKNNRVVWMGQTVTIGTGILVPAIAPGTCTGLTATPYSTTRIDLAWINPGGSFMGNRVYRSSDGINFTLLNTLSPVESYQSIGLSIGTKYYYKVNTFRGVHESEDSNIVNVDTYLITPTGLTLTILNNGIKIDWTPGDVDDDIEIYGKSDAGSYSLITTIASGTTTYNDEFAATLDLLVDLRTYRIRAKNSTFYSPYTSGVSKAMLGPELISDPGFNNPTAWGIGANWSVSGGKATFDDGGFTSITHTWGPNLVVGHHYRLMLDFSDLSAGNNCSVNLYTWDWVDFGITGHANNSKWIYDFIATGSHIGLMLYGDDSGSTGSFKIDNFTFKEILT
jgi:hypothetical protein